MKLSIILIYSIILTPSCKPRRSSQSVVKDVPTEESKFLDLIPEDDVESRRVMGTFTEVFRKMSLEENIPLVVIKNANAKDRRTPIKEEINGFKPLAPGEELFYGSETSRYILTFNLHQMVNYGSINDITSRKVKTGGRTFPSIQVFQLDTKYPVTRRDGGKTFRKTSGFKIDLDPNQYKTREQLEAEIPRKLAQLKSFILSRNLKDIKAKRNADYKRLEGQKESLDEEIRWRNDRSFQGVILGLVVILAVMMISFQSVNRIISTKLWRMYFAIFVILVLAFIINRAVTPTWIQPLIDQRNELSWGMWKIFQDKSVLGGIESR